MTENRLSYQAKSGEYPTHGRATSPSSLVQHYTDGTVSRDIIFLLPILESGCTSEVLSPCLQLIHLPNGDLSFCNTRTEHQCTCCGSACCLSHRRRGLLSFQDNAGVWQCVYDAPLCETCAGLTPQMRTALHAFRRLLNVEEAER